MKNYDVIVIGGGLAGLSLSIQLADAGKRVLLLEKNKYPFHRVCGEYISMESWDFIERLGLPLSKMNLPRISKLKVSSVNGKEVNASLDLGGFGISRFKLDSNLAIIAKAKGVEIKEGVTVTDVQFENDLFIVSTHENQYQAPIAAGTFGKRSNLDKKLERTFTVNSQKDSQNWVGVKYHLETREISDDSQSLLFDASQIQLHNFSGGYCGFSKIEDEKYCICYLTKASNLKKVNGNIQDMEEKLLSQNFFLKKIFSYRNQFVFKDPVTISQIVFDTKLPVEKHVLMIGDAAGMVAPLFGNGMSMALRASSIAFPLINKFLDGKISRIEMEKVYSHEWAKEFSLRLRTGRALQPILVDSNLSNLFIPLLKTFPFLFRQIIKATHGRKF